MPIPRDCPSLECSGWTYLTADGIVARRPVRFEGVAVNTSTSGDSVTLYSGLDVTSGRVIGTFKATANVTMIQNLIPPIPCMNGIYAVFNGNVDNITVFWSVI